VRKAPAQDAAESFPDFLVRRLRFLVENSLGSQDYATEAKAALGGALVDKGLLDGVRLIGCAEAFKGRDFVLANRADGHDTGAHHESAQDHGAGSALGHPAPEFRATQAKFVTQNKQQWC
jgi:hypothetical protein